MNSLKVHKSISYVVNKILVPLTFVGVLAYRLLLTSLDDLSIFQVISYFAIPILVCFFLITSKETRFTNLSKKSIFGIILSYGSLLVIRPNNSHFSTPELVLIYGTSIFYIIILFISHFNLGRSLFISPELKEVKTNFIFQEVRHPLYSCYIHLYLINIIIFPNIHNLLGLTLLFLGLHLRAQEAEVVLEEDSQYRTYKGKIKKRFFSFIISAPILFLAIGLVLFSNSSKAIKVQLSYPVLSLNPTIYDDWSSVFVANHIYPRLLFDKDRPWLQFIAKEYQLTCSDKNCIKEKIHIKYNTLVDCNNKLLEPSTITAELDSILAHKPWIFPGLQKCKKKYDACYTFHKQPDTRAKLENLYFRFGWSTYNNSNTLGFPPYCLTSIAKDDHGNISSGILKSRKHTLPDITFFSSASHDRAYDISLYGTDNSIKENIIKINSHTPLAYFIVWNKNLNRSTTPLDSPQIFKAIHNHFTQNNLIEPYPQDFTKKTTNTGNRDNFITTKGIAPTRTIRLALPSYIPNCDKLAHKLSDLSSNKLIVRCEDTTVFIDNKIRQKDFDWDAFISPLTPGYPASQAISTQYFSPNSLESWTYDEKKPENYYKLIGIGSSFVAVNSDMFCNIDPKFLGMGDLVITDFKKCYSVTSKLKDLINVFRSSSIGK